MAKYFSISTGLRGAYMPDNVYPVMVKSRRELKAILESEAQSVRDAEMVGCSKRAIAWLAHVAWQEAKKARPAFLPFVAEYRDKSQSLYPYGIFCSVISRAEYLESRVDE